MAGVERGATVGVCRRSGGQLRQRGDGRRVVEQFVRIPDDVEIRGDGQGSGPDSELDLFLDFGLLVPCEKFLALGLHEFQLMFHGQLNVFFKDRCRDAPGVDAQAEGEIGPFFRRSGSPLFVEHVVEADPAEGSFVSCLVNVPEGKFAQPVVDLAP